MASWFLQRNLRIWDLNTLESLRLPVQTKAEAFFASTIAKPTEKPSAFLSTHHCSNLRLFQDPPILKKNADQEQLQTKPQPLPLSPIYIFHAVSIAGTLLHQVLQFRTSGDCLGMQLTLRVFNKAARNWLTLPSFFRKNVSKRSEWMRPPTPKEEILVLWRHLLLMAVNMHSQIGPDWNETEGTQSKKPIQSIPNIKTYIYMYSYTNVGTNIFTYIHLDACGFKCMNLYIFRFHFDNLKTIFVNNIYIFYIQLSRWLP